MFDGNRKTGLAPADFVLRKCFPGQVRPQHSPDVVVVEVPGIQGPAGAKHGVLFTEQNLTEEQKAGAGGCWRLQVQGIPWTNLSQRKTCAKAIL